MARRAPAGRGATSTTRRGRRSTAPPGTFTDWHDFPPSDLLFYEGLHGRATTDTVNVARHADLKIGVVPVIILE